MAREKDTRNFLRRAGSEGQEKARVANFSDALPGDHQISAGRVNPLTGSAAVLTVDNAPTSDQPLIQQALDYLQTTIAEGAGFAAGEDPEFVPDPHVQRTSGGTAVVHLHQQYHGIPIFEMTRSVQFAGGTTIDRVVGDSTSIPQPLDTVPKVDVVAATRLAARYLAENHEEPTTDHWGQPYSEPGFELPADYKPKVIASFDQPSRPTTLDQGPFGDKTRANLVIFNQGDALRLAWSIVLTLPEAIVQYLVLVEADEAVDENTAPNGAVLYCKSLTQSICRANVFVHNPGQDNNTRSFVDFPRVSTTYPLASGQLPTPFPAAWWITKDQTVGNCTNAVRGISDSAVLSGTLSPTGDVEFNPADPMSDEQKILNIFYFCNYMHDFYYMLGFDEEAGNFQTANFTGKGTPGDPVLARAHPGPVTGTANMSTPVDGQGPLMNMGLVASTSRHTALDSDVVFHEYTHGLTNRLVGGRLNSLALKAPQSGGMGEGYSDYFALTIQNHGRTTERTVLGDWVIDRPGGIRMFPYDSSYPHKFGSLGTPPFTEVHNIGEIWCATLMQMNRNLGAALGSTKRGHELGWQLVVDSLKLCPANPSFLDARDATLRALDDREKTKKPGDTTDFPGIRKAVWQAFAKFGMGPHAACDGALLQGVVEDTGMPPGL
jgi:extracellular elastinolytic metalloproteinase